MGGEHQHELRDLEPGESGDPTAAWVEFASGERADLELERTGPLRWRARPREGVVMVSPGDHLRVDRMGAGVQVVFEDVLMRGAKGPGERDT